MKIELWRFADEEYFVYDDFLLAVPTEKITDDQYALKESISSDSWDDVIKEAKNGNASCVSALISVTEFVAIYGEFVEEKTQLGATPDIIFPDLGGRDQIRQFAEKMDANTVEFFGKPLDEILAEDIKPVCIESYYNYFAMQLRDDEKYFKINRRGLRHGFGFVFANLQREKSEYDVFPDDVQHRVATFENVLKTVREEQRDFLAASEEFDFKKHSLTDSGENVVDSVSAQETLATMMTAHDKLIGSEKELKEISKKLLDDVSQLLLDTNSPDVIVAATHLKDFIDSVNFVAVDTVRPVPESYKQLVFSRDSAKMPEIRHATTPIFHEILAKHPELADVLG